MGGIGILSLHVSITYADFGFGVGPDFCRRLYVKSGLIQGQCSRPCLPQVGGILIPSHLEIREMMQHGAETVLTILNILPGVQDMEMPKLIHQLGRYNEIFVILSMFKAQNEKTAIFL